MWMSWKGLWPVSFQSSPLPTTPVVSSALFYMSSPAGHLTRRHRTVAERLEWRARAATGRRRDLLRPHRWREACVGLVDDRLLRDQREAQARSCCCCCCCRPIFLPDRLFVGRRAAAFCPPHRLSGLVMAQVANVALDASCTRAFLAPTNTGCQTASESWGEDSTELFLQLLVKMSDGLPGRRSYAVMFNRTQSACCVFLLGVSLPLSHQDWKGTKDQTPWPDAVSHWTRGELVAYRAPAVEAGCAVVAWSELRVSR